MHPVKNGEITLVRRLIQQRELRGPQLQNNQIGRRVAKRALTSEGLVRAYQQEATRQKLRKRPVRPRGLTSSTAADHPRG